MKKITILLIAMLAVCFQSCTNRYEAAVKEFVETKDDMRFDMKFKMLETKEIKSITVKDSLELFQEKYNTLYNKDKQGILDLIAACEKYQNTMDNAKKVMSISNEKYEENLNEITKRKSQLERYDAQKFIKQDGKIYNLQQEVIKYEKMPQDSVLRIVVNCKYKAVMPIVNQEAEVTKDYLLSPDGKKCYGIYKEQK